MQIDKQAVLDLLREQGHADKVRQADEELPDQVDTERDASVLQRLGVDPGDLVSKFTGGSGIPGL